MAAIFLLEDDKALHKAILSVLKKDGYQINSAFSLKEALETEKKATSDLYLLDINLPDGSGIDFCRKLREQTDKPILFLTARNTEQNMIEGFRAGCDDYISKPFPLAVLNKKIAAILRRTQNNHTNNFNYRDMEINYEKMTVAVGGEEIKLTATEYKLLSFLAKNKGRVLTRSILLEQIWDSDGNFIDENTLSVHIRRLRQKIEPEPTSPRYIITVFGIGYTFGED